MAEFHLPPFDIAAVIENVGADRDRIYLINVARGYGKTTAQERFIRENGIIYWLRRCQHCREIGLCRRVPLTRRLSLVEKPFNPNVLPADEWWCGLCELRCGPDPHVLE